MPDILLFQTTANNLHFEPMLLAVFIQSEARFWQACNSKKYKQYNKIRLVCSIAKISNVLDFYYDKIFWGPIQYKDVVLPV